MKWFAVQSNSEKWPNTESYLVLVGLNNLQTQMLCGTHKKDNAGNFLFQMPLLYSGH